MIRAFSISKIVFRSDRNGVLKNYFTKHSTKSHHAIDFGCGTGKAFPYLSPAFARVTGYDISAELLKLAKTRPFKNVELKQADLTRKDIKFPSADFLFCCNVIMLPGITMNRLLLGNVNKALRNGGHALIVLPSLESILFASWRLMEWYKTEGVKPEKPASGKLLLRVPPEVHGKALVAAQASGKSLNQWVAEVLQNAVHTEG